MTKITNTSAVILAGGKSSRMGTDKSQLKIGDTTFSQKLMDDFARHFSNVYLSVTTDSPLTGPNILHDEKPGLGPLSGLMAAIKGTEGDSVFICATDMPFADPVLAARLTEQLEHYDACLIRSENGRVETAFAVFSKRILPTLTDELESGKRSIMGLLGRINTRIVDVSQLKFVDPKAFMNVNTPDDYAGLFDI